MSTKYLFNFFKHPNTEIKQLNVLFQDELLQGHIQLLNMANKQQSHILVLCEKSIDFSFLNILKYYLNDLNVNKIFLINENLPSTQVLIKFQSLFPEIKIYQKTLNEL